MTFDRVIACGKCGRTWTKTETTVKRADKWCDMMLRLHLKKCKGTGSSLTIADLENEVKSMNSAPQAFNFDEFEGEPCLRQMDMIAK